jgi:transcriptional regulator with XRE-family HTH domain
MDIFRLRFGERLGAALAEAGMRQNELAEKLNVKDSTVSRWVNGKDFPEGARISDICRALNKPEDYFTAPEVVVKEAPLPKWASDISNRLGDLESAVKLRPAERRILDILATMNESQLDQVFVTVDGIRNSFARESSRANEKKRTS